MTTPLPPSCLALAASRPGSVLLQSARLDDANSRSYLFTDPVRVLAAHPALFDDIEAALAGGAHVAGFFSYECGENLSALQRPQTGSAPLPLAWFGVYPRAFVFNHRTGAFEAEAPANLPACPPQPPPFEIRNLALDISQPLYTQKIAAIHDYIRAGDTYQVNFTDRARFDFSGSPQAMFQALLAAQPVSYSAFLHADDWHILSFSPELFFRLDGRAIVTRPMKGTAPRGACPAEDETIARWLRHDVKNRSENLMIVDLLRNDLGRICDFGSVHVDQLFTLEKYETLFQMTSQVSGRLRPQMRLADIFSSLFPSGSVTGAPKHRTLQIIQELESAPRGVYTGAIGFFSPARQAVFSVPIRTVVLERNRGTMGLGSGIVIDSRPHDEFAECLLKAEFLSRRQETFQLFESILWCDGYARLPLHIERLAASAACLGFPFDPPALLAALDKLQPQLAPGAPVKVRVLLHRLGALDLTHSPAGDWPALPRLLISPDRVSSADRLLRHKTTRRPLHDRQLALARLEGCDEVLFLNERGELTEGAISNVFLSFDGHWFTPPVASGLLPGTCRQHLLSTRPNTFEKVLYLSDLATADAIYICNAVRGCRQATIVPRPTSSNPSPPALSS